MRQGGMDSYLTYPPEKSQSEKTLKKSYGREGGIASSVVPDRSSVFPRLYSAHILQAFLAGAL